MSLETGNSITKSGLHHRFNKVKNLVDKIIVNDDIIDVYLKNGEKTTENVERNKIESLCVTATGQIRTHTEKIYSQKVRRIKKRSVNSWLYFNVYI